MTETKNEIDGKKDHLVRIESNNTSDVTREDSQPLSYQLSGSSISDGPKGLCT